MLFIRDRGSNDHPNQWSCQKVPKHNVWVISNVDKQLLQSKVWFEFSWSFSLELKFKVRLTAESDDPKELDTVIYDIKGTLPVIEYFDPSPTEKSMAKMKRFMERTETGLLLFVI